MAFTIFFVEDNLAGLITEEELPHLYSVPNLSPESIQLILFMAGLLTFPFFLSLPIPIFMGTVAVDIQKIIPPGGGKDLQLRG